MLTAQRDRRRSYQRSAAEDSLWSTAAGGRGKDPRSYFARDVTRDGGVIAIRAIRPDDQERLHDHFKGLSEKSVYFRFMGIRRDLSPQDLKNLTELDFRKHVGLAATLSQAVAIAPR